MSKVEDGKAVGIAYEIYNESGEQIEATLADQPFYYLHGVSEELLPELEKTLAGKSAGDSFEMTLSPAEAFGERDEKDIFEVGMDSVEDIEMIEVGMTLDMEEGEYLRSVTVVEKADDYIVVDANHPFAGMTLTFKVKVDDIRDATEEELEHGHVHIEGDCGHDHDHG